KAFRRRVPQKTNRLGFGNAAAVRVKRWCKRPPLAEKSTRHGKPHREQDQIGDFGAARSCPGKPGESRVLVAQTNDSRPPRGGAQNSAYSPSKIRFLERGRPSAEIVTPKLRRFWSAVR